MELLKLLLRNTLRHKLRSLLTIVGVSVAVMAFALLQTVVTAWHAGVEASAANRLITRHAVSFVFPLPLAYRDRIAQVPGVNKVTYAVWFSGVYIDKNQFFGAWRWIPKRSLRFIRNSSFPRTSSTLSNGSVTLASSVSISRADT